VGRETLNLLVSIVINNYNYARFLRAAIDSALSQSYASIEVLVVDDGSTDQSCAIIDSYGDRVKPILKKNGGQASALNAGFAQCQGDIVIFLDADDVLLPHAAQQVVNAFSAQPQTAKVQYRMEVIDQGGHQTGAIKPPHHLPLPAGDLKKQEMLFPFDLTWLPTSGNAFSATVLKKIFPIPEQPYRILADYYLVHLTTLCGSIVSLDQVCAYYRVHGANNYEALASRIDLPHIRSTLVYADQTRHYLQQFAERLNLSDRPTEILAVSYVANRITSLKLEPDQHPIVGDTAGKLFRLALIAISRRSDVAWPMKGMFGVWFALMVIAPKSLAHWLAEAFFFPERRTRLNHWLGTLHRSGQGV
jgi:glycosyltransferase involved in cell wall biosynthesis